MSLAGPEVQEFARSLPPSYRDRYARVAVEAHAHLSATRGDRLLVVDVFDDGVGGTALALVTNDRPGVLVLASSALTAEGFDIADAQFYTRERPSGEREALALFWPQTKSGRRVEFSAADLLNLRGTLTGLLEGRGPCLARDRDEVESAISSGTSSGDTRTPDTRVRFVEGNDGSLSVLEVETVNRSGLLVSLARALFAARVQIIRSEARTVGERVFDRFTITEPNGGPVDSERRFAIQVAVLSALDPNLS